MTLENTSSTVRIAESVLHIYRSTFRELEGEQETEYMEKDGALCINIAIEKSALNDRTFSAVIPQDPGMRRFDQQPEHTLALTIRSPGLLDTLRFVDDMIDDPLASEKIEI